MEIVCGFLLRSYKTPLNKFCKTLENEVHPNCPCIFCFTDLDSFSTSCEAASLEINQIKLVFKWLRSEQGLKNLKKVIKNKNSIHIEVHFLYIIIIH